MRGPETSRRGLEYESWLGTNTLPATEKRDAGVTVKNEGMGSEVPPSRPIRARDRSRLHFRLRSESARLPLKWWTGRESNASHRACKAQSPPWYMPALRWCPRQGSNLRNLRYVEPALYQLSYSDKNSGAGSRVSWPEAPTPVCLLPGRLPLRTAAPRSLMKRKSG